MITAIITLLGGIISHPPYNNQKAHPGISDTGVLENFINTAKYAATIKNAMKNIIVSAFISPLLQSHTTTWTG